jgi:hypothetical protein
MEARAQGVEEGKKLERTFIVEEVFKAAEDARAETLEALKPYLRHGPACTYPDLPSNACTCGLAEAIPPSSSALDFEREVAKRERDVDWINACTATLGIGFPVNAPEELKPVVEKMLRETRRKVLEEASATQCRGCREQWRYDPIRRDHWPEVRLGTGDWLSCSASGIRILIAELSRPDEGLIEGGGLLPLAWCRNCEKTVRYFISPPQPNSLRMGVASSDMVCEKCAWIICTLHAPLPTSDEGQAEGGE